MISWIVSLALQAPTHSISEKIKLSQSASMDAQHLSTKPPRSKEWKKLPRQAWEQNHLALPPEIDPLGFDRRSVIRFKKPTGFDLPVFVSTDRVPLLGQIIGAKSEGVYLSMGDLVYLRSDRELQVGESYAITQEPYVLRARKSERLGYSYMVLGQVKVTGVKDGLFLGIIESAREFVSRGASLVTLPSRIRNLSPIPGPEGVEGVVVLDRNFSTYTAAQHKLVAIDRGTQDGVQPGMVFRVYEYVDPSNNKRVTNSHIVEAADIIVVQVTQTHSEGLVIRGNGPIYENNPVILLSDVRDLTRARQAIREKLGASQPKTKTELDELDAIDTGGDIGQEEEKELKQLERWRGNPEQEQEELLPDTEEAPLPAPMDSVEDLPTQTPRQVELDETSPITPEVAAPPEEEKPTVEKAKPPIEEPEFPAL